MKSMRYDQIQRQKKRMKKHGQKIGKGLIFKEKVRRGRIMGIKYTIQYAPVLPKLL